MRVEDWLGKNNEIGCNIWQNKYRFEKETFDAWLDRISQGNNAVKQLIIDKKFLFGGRILANRGLTEKGVKITYSNCYVIEPPEDNIESIYETAGRLARTYSYGGGCGLDISKLAPRGAKVNNSAKQTSGAVSFMQTYSDVTEQIGQNGRRGALMISLDCHHPDLEEFIDVKTDLSKVNKANISIRFTDDFMQAVEKNQKFKLEFIRDETQEKITKTVDARSVFMKLAENNWNFAEPGCLFWDRIENYNLLANTDEFHYAGTNPCAEEPLPAGGSCLLGSMNLSAFVKYDDTSKPYFDYSDFKRSVEIAVTALNEVLDEGLPLHPLQEQRNSVRDWRQIGLGIMGLADMLIKLGVKYGSAESLSLCDDLGRMMAETALLQSSKLASKHKPFPKCNMDEIVGTQFFADNVTDSETYNTIYHRGLYNSQLLTIAPTGTLSTMLGISGGIEPIFASYYVRKTESLHGKDVYYKVYTPIFENYMSEHNIKDEDDLPEYFITSKQLNYKDRICMQATWQKHIDASISSTVNVPNDFTVEDTFNLYMYAWKQGLKGVTIFRDGCKRIGVLTTDESKAVSDSLEKRGEWHKKASDTRYDEIKLHIGCGKIILFVGWSDKEQAIQDFFVKRSGTGGCAKLLESTAIAMSGILRYGGNLESISKAFNGIDTCPSFASARSSGRKLSPGNSCGQTMLRALQNYVQEHTRKDIPVESDKKKLLSNKYIEENEFDVKKIQFCKFCGAQLPNTGGCQTCPNCGETCCEN